MYLSKYSFLNRNSTSGVDPSDKVSMTANIHTNFMIVKLDDC